MFTTFGFTFLFFLVLNFFIKFWLDCRQIRSVRSHRDCVPHAFVSKISLFSHQKAADYTITSIRFTQKERFASLIFLMISTFGGLINWLSQTCENLVGPGIVSQLLIVVSFSVINTLCFLPFSWYSQFSIEERFGFNTQTKSRFFKDLGLNIILSAIIGLPFLTLLFYLWEVAGPSWWIWAWLFYVIFNLALLWIYPTFIAPIFNKFTPLPEGELKKRVDSLLDRIGFENNGLFVMDASKRSAKGNAYMTGFGRNKRIVFFDTLLSKLEPAEVEAVLAHELGHYKLKHIQKNMLVSFTVSFVFFALLAYLAQCAWFYEGLGISYQPENYQASALLLFFFVLPVFLFPLTPLTNKLSRKHEFEADHFAVCNSNGDSLISALVKLFNDNASTLTPDSIYSLFYSSHPDASTRIEAIRRNETRNTHVSK